MTDSTSIAPTAVTANLSSAEGIDLSQLEQVRTEVQAWQTSHGTQVRFVEARQLPMIDLIVLFNAGTSVDAEHSGLAALTMYMLDEGTERLNAEQFAEQTERLGAILSTQIRLEHASLSLRCLSSEVVLAQAMALFTEMLARPAFDEQQLVKVKQQLRAFQSSRYNAAPTRAQSELFSRLYAGHPYAAPLGSTEQGIQALTAQDLRDFHQRAYSANNLQVSIVGDLSRAQAEALVEQLAEALPQGWAAAELPPVPPTSAASAHVPTPAANNTLLLAVPMSGRPSQPDYPALVLAADVLGSGFDSRLMQELRQRRGLTYHISCRPSPLKAGGVLAIGWDCAAQYREASRELVAGMLEALVNEGPTNAELELSRRQLSGQLVRSVATNSGLVELLSKGSHQGLPADHLVTYQAQLSAVSARSARHALQEHLDLSRMVTVSLGSDQPQQPLPPLPHSAR